MENISIIRRINYLLNIKMCVEKVKPCKSYVYIFIFFSSNLDEDSVVYYVKYEMFFFIQVFVNKTYTINISEKVF